MTWNLLTSAKYGTGFIEGRKIFITSVGFAGLFDLEHKDVLESIKRISEYYEITKSEKIPYFKRSSLCCP